MNPEKRCSHRWKIIEAVPAQNGDIQHSGRWFCDQCLRWGWSSNKPSPGKKYFSNETLAGAKNHG